MNKTSIGWTDYSSNPLRYREAGTNREVWACVKTSPGCANCYAEAMGLRLSRGVPFTRAGLATVRPELNDKELGRVLRAPGLAGKKVFLNDMTDCFGDWVPDVLLDRMFAALACRPDVIFQVLTKRADRMAAYFTAPDRKALIFKQVAGLSDMSAEQAGRESARIIFADVEPAFRDDRPFPNVWLGVSVENQAMAKERIRPLLTTPAAVRFLSCEPLLSELTLTPWFDPMGVTCGAEAEVQCQCRGCVHAGTFPRGDDGLFAEIDWVIVGGESGDDARPFQVEWARSLIKQCRAHGVACFVKQIGSSPRERELSDWPDAWPNGTRRINLVGDGFGNHCVTGLRHRNGADPTDWPEDLRVQQFPQVEATS